MKDQDILTSKGPRTTRNKEGTNIRPPVVNLKPYIRHEIIRNIMYKPTKPHQKKKETLYSINSQLFFLWFSLPAWRPCQAKAVMGATPEEGTTASAPLRPCFFFKETRGAFGYKTSLVHFLASLLRCLRLFQITTLLVSFGSLSSDSSGSNLNRPLVLWAIRLDGFNGNDTLSTCRATGSAQPGQGERPVVWFGMLFRNSPSGRLI